MGLDFAEKLLRQQGWQPGMGLGKNNTGISKPIEVKKGSDKLGVGYDPDAEYTHWWDKAYNNAVKTVSDEDKNKNGDSQDSIEIFKPKYFKSSDLYKNFTEGQTIKSLQLPARSPSKSSPISQAPKTPVEGLLLGMSSHELLKLSGGSTGHRAMRHGALQGKLARIKKMEQQSELREVMLKCDKSLSASKDTDSDAVYNDLKQMKECVKQRISGKRNMGATIGFSYGDESEIGSKDNLNFSIDKAECESDSGKSKDKNYTVKSKRKISEITEQDIAYEIKAIFLSSTLRQASDIKCNSVEKKRKSKLRHGIDSVYSSGL